MEDVYPRVPRTDTRELYLRDLGSEPRRLLPVGHRPHVLGGDVASTTAGCCATPSRWAANEPPPVEVDGPRRARRDRVAAARLDDGAPRQPDQPDDDEGAAARNDSGRAADGARPPAGRTRARERCSC